MPKLQVWTCTDHAGHYPVGVASVIVARGEIEARHLLTKALELRNLEGSGFTLQKLDMNKSHALILNDGNY